MRTDNFHGESFLNIFHEDGNKFLSKKYAVQDLQMLFCSVSGRAKTTAVECVAENYHNEGYINVILTEKEISPLEFAFCLFEPKEEYHLQILKESEKNPGKKTAKIYHPTIINEELKKSLPNINFYSISIKDINKDELSLLLEVPTGNDTLVSIYNEIRGLNSNEGLFDLLYKLKKKLKKDSYKRIREIFKPFEDNYFLLSENDSISLKIDYSEIMKNQKDYHIFTYKWVNDKKLRYFLVIHNFNKLIEAMTNAQYPVLFIIQEARAFIPETEDIKEFFVIKTAELIKAKLSQIRSVGKGGSTIADSQVFYDVEKNYRNTINATFFGSLSAGDLERTAKVYRFGNYQKKMLENMPIGYFMFLQSNNKSIVKFGMPSHCHAEKGYDFFQMYRKNYPDLLKNYSDLLKELKGYYSFEKNRFEERKKADFKAHQEKEKKTLEKREGKEELKEQIKQIKELSKKDKDVIKDRIIQSCKDDSAKGMSLRSIAKKYGIGSPNTVKKYLSMREEKA